jgi:tripartite-type tricarboxylate transporter receptor subunit TctC
MNQLIKQAIAGAALLLAALLAQAQVDKPVRLLVGFAPGGATDIAARLLAERLTAELKHNVFVENKPGAGARIAAAMLKDAAPDGSTLMLAPIFVPVLAPLVFSKLAYDPLVDFAPVAHVANFQFGIVVNAGHPAKSVQDLVAWFKANAAQANFGTPGAGSLPHFFGVMISRGAGIDPVHVTFNGGSALMNAVVGNQVSSGIDTLVDQIQMHRGGKIRILATSGAARSPELPDVPTFAEAGLKGVEGTSWYAVYAPAKTSAATVRQLNAAINKALEAPELKERFAKLGLEPTGGSAADLLTIMKRDTERWGPVIKASGFKSD